MAFVEWMQGFPEGWVDGLERRDALRCLGNAVVPLQGAAAVGLLEKNLGFPMDGTGNPGYLDS